MNEPPARGFPESEYRARTGRAQALMTAGGLDAMLLTSEADLRYFTGFLTQFWQSPTRPWFLVVPAAGKPVAVIPEIGAALMSRTWIEDIRTWPSPRPADEGISLLADTVAELCGSGGRLGIPMGPETHLRMPLADYERLRDLLHGVGFADASAVMRELRMVKSPAEIEKIAWTCSRTGTVFAELPAMLRPGMSEREIFRSFKTACLKAGLDDVTYLVGGAGQGGYGDIISPPSDRPISAGDVLMLDTGATFDGYYCDFDRNYVLPPVADATRRAHDVLYEATEAGFAVARPGSTCREVFVAMRAVLEAGGAPGNNVGRLGHGLGMQLTEWPSLTHDDSTELKPGMVLTLEPAMTIAPGKGMVHEENIVIEPDGPRWLTPRAPAELPLIR
ncbi:MAG: M24 family metallopeptidase [Dichotomicrobium sp.]